MKIQLLNHASCLLTIGELKILSDPWLEGTAFSGGWGLRFENPDAWKAAASATHLWISHFHPDHFHPQTLKKLLALNPNLVVLCNDSHNFTFTPVMQKMGFKNTLSLKERVPLKLGEICLERIPTTGIDNMLVIKSPQFTVLNYNDCNLTPFARNLIARQIGPIDVFLSNFNHAEKFLEFPARTPEEIKAQLKKQYRSTLAAFQPHYAIPFASYHYYRTPGTREQNQSMLTLKEVVELDAHVLPLELGSEVEFTGQSYPVFAGPNHAVSPAILEIHREKLSADLTELEASWIRFRSRVFRHSLGLSCLLPALKIRISDLNQTVTLGFGRLAWHEGASDALLECESAALQRWWDNQYGTDTFWIGGHFSLLNSDLLPLRLIILLGLLSENKLSPFHLLAMFFSSSGRTFLWNRREEIGGVLASRHFMMGTARANAASKLSAGEPLSASLPS